MSLRCANGHDAVGWSGQYTRRCWVCGAEGVAGTVLTAATPPRCRLPYTHFEGSIVERPTAGWSRDDTEAQVTG